MNLLIIFTAVILSGCFGTTTPPVIPFPAKPVLLQTDAPTLRPLGPTEHLLTDVLNNANYNYGQFYLMKDRCDAWDAWYADQKKIYDTAEKKLK